MFMHTLIFPEPLPDWLDSKLDEGPNTGAESEQTVRTVGSDQRTKAWIQLMVLFSTCCQDFVLLLFLK